MICKKQEKPKCVWTASARYTKPSTPTVLHRIYSKNLIQPFRLRKMHTERTQLKRYTVLQRNPTQCARLSPKTNAQKFAKVDRQNDPATRYISASFRKNFIGFLLKLLYAGTSSMIFKQAFTLNFRLSDLELMRTESHLCFSRNTRCRNRG